VEEVHQLIRLGQAQRQLEKILTRDMTEKEIVQHTLETARDHILGVKGWEILEAWALREYHD
jgi:hypothetical protein